MTNCAFVFTHILHIRCFCRICPQPQQRRYLQRLLRNRERIWCNRKASRICFSSCGNDRRYREYWPPRYPSRPRPKSCIEENRTLSPSRSAFLDDNRTRLTGCCYDPAPCCFDLLLSTYPDTSGLLGLLKTSSIHCHSNQRRTIALSQYDTFRSLMLADEPNELYYDKSSEQVAVVWIVRA